MRRTLPLLAACLLLTATARADEPTPDVTEPPPADQFVVVPLRVHILQSDDLPEIDCALTDADIERILTKLNRIWNVAGVHFGLESIRREPAELGLWFRSAKEERRGRPLPLGLYTILRPEASREFEGLHVYYIHRFAVNGVYLGDGVAFVQETAALRPVEGGIDEPIPRVTAHELGHALGLPHRQDTTNLLASGTTGTRLNRAEAERARGRATQIPGALAVPDLKVAVERADMSPETARRLRSWLDQIPGAEPSPQPD